MNWRQAAVDFLFPPKCPFCRRVTEGARVCPQCGKDLPWTEGKDREQTLAGGLRCASPLWYEDLARDGILRFKFHGGAGAETLGSLLADCAAERCSGEFDLVTWVPVSKRRRRKRGYDQAELLAESACRRWDTEPVPLLRKITDNPAQSSLSGAAARRANVLGVLLADCAAERYSGEFDLVTWVPVSKKRRRKRGYDQTELLARSACRLWETEPVRLLQKVTDNPAQSSLQGAAARRANVLGVYDAVGDCAGKRVLLLDDIVTTGETLRECARVLRDAGAAEILALTLGRTRERKESSPAVDERGKMG